MIHLLPIAGLALAAAYLMGQSNRQTGTGANPGVPVVNVGGTGATTTPALDVAGDVVNTEVDALQTQPGLDTNSNAPDHFRHLWLPASKVPISSLSSYDFRLALALLSGGLHRRPDLEPNYQHAIEEIQAQATGAEASGIIGAVASIVPVIGAVLSKISGMETSELGSDISSTLGNIGADMSQLRTTVNPSNLDPPAQMLLAPVWQGDGTAGLGDEPMTFETEPWVAEAGVIAKPPVGITGVIPASYFAAMPFRPRTDQAVVYRYSPRRRLFTMFQYGLILPWVSDELIADATSGQTLRQAINVRARVYRAIDVICCLAYPDNNVLDISKLLADDNPLATGNWTAGWYNMPKESGATDPLYYYINPSVGNMFGSIFPPTAEDKHIFDADGFPRDFQGNRVADALTANSPPVKAPILTAEQYGAEGVDVDSSILPGVYYNADGTVTVVDSTGWPVNYSAAAWAAKQAATVPTKPVAVSTVGTVVGSGGTTSAGTKTGTGLGHAGTPVVLTPPAPPHLTLESSLGDKANDGGIIIT
jgi:hypothetical protein